ncbi:asparagine-rich zinc finger protein AZF1-like [Penaeus monodon]|uniref:asparagine-rich zinc finger protein AZF1-like n=1 Tax=Penaeus monodon TaxID=6687 RepID=UPI0018A7C583|nr:asparagine-rich zinc finger protein AZF1-like [Penaeus monodon]
MISLEYFICCNICNYVEHNLEYEIKVKATEVVMKKQLVLISVNLNFSLRKDGRDDDGRRYGDGRILTMSGVPPALSPASEGTPGVPSSEYNRGGIVHQCPYCFKRFGLRTDLRRHLRTHTGEKPFACSVCNFRTALKGNLKRHMIRFHGVESGFE